MAPNTGNRKVIVIGGLLGLAVLGAIIATAAKSPAKQAATSSPSPSPSTAPASSTMATPTPDRVAKGPSMPAFAGFDGLIREGVTNNQLDALKYGYFKYSKSINKNIAKVTLKPETVYVVPHNRYSASSSNYLTFTADLDGTSYPAKLEYSGFYVSRLYLSNAQTGAQIYDSDIIDLYHGIGNN